MDYSEFQGTIRQGSRTIAEKTPIQLHEHGAIWSGTFSDLTRDKFGTSDQNYFFTLELEDGRVGEVNISFHKTSVIPFEVSFEGVEKEKFRKF